MTATTDHVPADMRAAIDELRCIARSAVALARKHIPRTARDPALANAIRHAISAVDGVFALLDHHDEAVRRTAMDLVPGLATCGAARDGEFPALGHRCRLQPEAELAEVAILVDSGVGPVAHRLRDRPPVHARAVVRDPEPRIVPLVADGEIHVVATSEGQDSRRAARKNVARGAQDRELRHANAEESVGQMRSAWGPWGGGGGGDRVRSPWP